MKCYTKISIICYNKKPPFSKGYSRNMEVTKQGYVGGQKSLFRVDFTCMKDREKNAKQERMREQSG